MRSTRPHLSRVESFQTSGSVGWKLPDVGAVAEEAGTTDDGCPFGVLLGVFFFVHRERGGEEKVGGWVDGVFFSGSKN